MPPEIARPVGPPRRFYGHLEDIPQCRHGEWLPWLNGEIESGRLQVKVRQTQKYMQLASNTHRGAYLEEAPSIRAALELLSDQEPETEQGTLIDVEAERKAREAAEEEGGNRTQSPRNRQADQAPYQHHALPVAGYARPQGLEGAGV
jgi:hypothetical protein